MLDVTQLRQIMPNVPAAKVAQLLPYLNSAMMEYGIDSAARAAAFLAQLAHESGEFRWMEEIWGPTPAQRRYEPATELAKRLGNTQPGDGKRFKGRGPIQLTGRANYQRFGRLLGIDLVSEPEQAAEPDVAFRVAALYWASRGLNELADRQDFREITRRINGGFNGMADRTKYFDRARKALAGWVATRAGAWPRAARSLPAEPLSRGHEVIRELSKPARGRRKAVKAPARRKSVTRTSARRKAGRKTAAKQAAATRKSHSRGSVARSAKAKSTIRRKASSKATRRKPAKRATAAARKR
jgi:predicted chitinase